MATLWAGVSVPAIALEVIVPVTAIENIVAAAPFDIVGARATIDGIARVRVIENVVKRGKVDDCHERLLGSNGRPRLKCDAEAGLKDVRDCGPHY
jgi:hypothetical protein